MRNEERCAILSHPGMLMPSSAHPYIKSEHPTVLLLTLSTDIPETAIAMALLLWLIVGYCTYVLESILALKY
jgi:hypothetical protein